MWIGPLLKSLSSRVNKVFKESNRILERSRNPMLSRSTNLSLSNSKVKIMAWCIRTTPILVNLILYRMEEKASLKKTIWWNSKLTSCKHSSIITPSCFNRSAKAIKSYYQRNQIMSVIRASLKNYSLNVLMRSRRILAKELKIKILRRYTWQIPGNQRLGKSRQQVLDSSNFKALIRSRWSICFCRTTMSWCFSMKSCSQLQIVSKVIQS